MSLKGQRTIDNQDKRLISLKYKKFYPINLLEVRKTTATLKQRIST